MWDYGSQFTLLKGFRFNFTSYVSCKMYVAFLGDLCFIRSHIVARCQLASVLVQKPVWHVSLEEGSGCRENFEFCKIIQIVQNRRSLCFVSCTSGVLHWSSLVASPHACSLIMLLIYAMCECICVYLQLHNVLIVLQLDYLNMFGLVGIMSQY